MIIKKLVPILVIIMLSTMIVPGTVSATKNTKLIPTYINIYENNTLFPNTVNHITVHKNEICHFSAHLMKQRGLVLPYRYINYELLHSNGTVIKTGRKLSDTTLIGFLVEYQPPTYFVLGKLEVGEYILKVSYNGNKKGLAPCNKTIPLYVK